ncbi:MAG: hypothetical protein FD149_1174 [Rhodospirillaceae bacterium]|nr:MAG: hypothetical protein FD149_1174 [Rhodospirillaceae bacterium]
MSEVTHPHDRLFKGLLDQPGAAGALLRERLPPQVAALLTDDPPELMPGEYVDEALRDSRSDRLYRARLRAGGDLFFYVLLDHKSTPNASILLQILGYLPRIWWSLVDGGAGTLRSLPPILPLVVYHGARPWTVSLSLREVINAPEGLKSYLPDVRYDLVDLGPIPDPNLSAYPPLRAGLLVLKYSHRDCDAETVLVQAFTDAKDQPALFSMLTVYTTVVYSNVAPAVLRHVIRTVKPEWEETMISIAAREWMAEGWAKGKAEGRVEGEAKGLAEGKAETLLLLLRLRCGPLSPEIEERVRTAGGDQLDVWVRRVAHADSLADVFGLPH